MNSTEGFENHETSILHEERVAVHEEEVIVEDLLTLLELLLSSIKIKVHMKALNKLGNRILVRVRLLQLQIIKIC